MSDIALNTLITLTMPEGTISDMGQALILSFIASQRIQEGEWKALNPETPFHYLTGLPSDWKWVWMITEKGDYVGTFPKRVSKFYFERMRLKCPQSFLSHIGNLARDHSTEPLTHTFEFVDHADWTPGEFGDSGSCWWGSYEQGKEIFLDAGGMAVRFYDSEGDGLGRAWFAKYRTGYIVFNGYGMGGDSTLKIAQIVAHYLGMSYKRIHLTNHNDLMYINSDMGYAIGEASAIERFNSVEFEYGERGYTCDHCGETVGEDYTFSGPNGHGTYCESCYYNLFSSCENCCETFYQSEMTYVRDHGEYCNDCLRESFSYCEGCHEYHPDDDVTLCDDHFWCEACRDERFTLCDECQFWREKNTVTENEDGDTRCEKCKGEADE